MPGRALFRDSCEGKERGAQGFVGQVGRERIDNGGRVGKLLAGLLWLVARRVPLTERELDGPQFAWQVEHFSQGACLVERANGRLGTFTMQVVEYEPNESEIIQVTAGPGIRPTQTFLFESTRMGTRLNFRVDVQTQGLFRLMAPVLPRMIRKKWAGYLVNLKSVLAS